MVLLLFFVDFESDGVVVIEEDAEEIVKVDLLVPLGDLVNVDGHGQVLQYNLTTIIIFDGVLIIKFKWRTYYFCF